MGKATESASEVFSVLDYEKMRDALIAQGVSEKEAASKAAAKWWEKNPEAKNPFVQSNPNGLSPAPSNLNTFTIAHIDDEAFPLSIFKYAVEHHKAFGTVSIHQFLNRDAAAQEVVKNPPDLLVTDLRSDNVPGRKQDYGMSGFELLNFLSQQNFAPPILVFSGSLSMPGIEDEARRCSGGNLKVTFLQKPATSEQICCAVEKAIGREKASSQHNESLPKENPKVKNQFALSVDQDTSRRQPNQTIKKENLIIIRNSAIFAAAGAVGTSIGCGAPILICFILFFPMFIVAYLLGFPWTKKVNHSKRHPMSFFNILFGKPAKTHTLLDSFQEVSARLIVKGYRKIADQNDCAPTSKTTDDEIMMIHKIVTTAFHQAADRRGERIPALIENNIVFNFLQLYEMTPGHLQQHLQYEIEKYVKEGLRPDYKRELPLFDPDGNDPDVRRLHEISERAVLGKRNKNAPALQKSEPTDATSQFFLGMNYQQGKSGYRKDYAEAAKWYRMAADQGHAGAQLYLGYLFAKGQGVRADCVEAYKWIELAKNGNFLDRAAANESQKKLMAYMRPEHIAEGKRRAREFASKHG